MGFQVLMTPASCSGQTYGDSRQGGTCCLINRGKLLLLLSIVVRDSPHLHRHSSSGRIAFRTVALSVLTVIAIHVSKGERSRSNDVKVQSASVARNVRTRSGFVQLSERWL